MFKKNFSDEEITDWFRYKDYFLEERKKDPDFELDLKYLKIANAYNEIVKKCKSKKQK